MKETLYAISLVLFTLSPFLLIIGLIRPGSFKRFTGGKPRRGRIALYAVTIFFLSVAVAGISEPEWVKQDKLAREQTKTTQQTQKPEENVGKNPAITKIEETSDGHTISGEGISGETMELQTGGEKYKITANDKGEFTSEPIKSFLPYGEVGLYKLEKSFFSTKAIHKQTKYYSLFANQPQLSDEKLPAQITEVKKDGDGFKLQGFYLPQTELELKYNDQDLKNYKTHKDGFFVFTSLPNKEDTMDLSIVSDGGTEVASKYVFIPGLLLLDQTPEVKTETKTEAIAFQSSTQEDAGLTKGVTRVVTSGRNGQKTLTYKVTFIDGKEVKRDLASETVTVAPVNEVKKVGTYVYIAPPTPAPKPSSSSSSNQIPASGPTAKCRDGTFSYSQNRRGTCSHHGGVAVWY